MDAISDSLTPAEAYEFCLLALCVWREARGEIVAAKQGVAWTIRNRVKRPSWWGTDWVTVILKPWQFSSFNAGDPNAVKFPQQNDTSWMACLQAAADVYGAASATDPTGGATHYFDDSIAPPSWTKDGSLTFKTKIGSLNFYG